MLIAGGHSPDATGKFPGIDENAYREAFAGLYADLLPETFSPQAAEAMFFSNNPIMNEIIVEEFAEEPPDRAVSSTPSITSTPFIRRVTRSS